ncbi:hypothetical protein DL98DRAFT_294873 [Cadophora sp. DSE1049]|nr:hypothetical protein DL98DRAFT_294873 [Cadophora sp. DSE1049]
MPCPACLPCDSSPKILRIGSDSEGRDREGEQAAGPGIIGWLAGHGIRGFSDGEERCSEVQSSTAEGMQRHSHHREPQARYSLGFRIRINLPWFRASKASKRLRLLSVVPYQMWGQAQVSHLPVSILLSISNHRYTSTVLTGISDINPSITS